MASNNVLLDIFNTLHRLESRLEGQNYRLDNIENSMQTGCNSARLDEIDYSISSNECGSNSWSYREKPLPAQPGLDIAEASPAELYVASIKEMRTRFEFLDDSESAIHPTRDETLRAEEGSPTRSQQLRPPLREHRKDDQSTYTHSVYSTDLLSSAKVSVPVVETHSQQNKIECSTITPGQGKEKFVTVIGDNAEATSPTVSARTFSVRSLRTLSIKYRSGRTSVDSQSSESAQESYEIATITYYACNNFVDSLQTSKSLHSREKRYQEREHLRLLALSAPKGTMHNSADGKSPRSTTWAVAFRKLFNGIFSGAMKVRAQSIYVVA